MNLSVPGLASFKVKYFGMLLSFYKKFLLRFYARLGLLGDRGHLL